MNTLLKADAHGGIPRCLILEKTIGRKKQRKISQGSRRVIQKRRAMDNADNAVPQRCASNGRVIFRLFGQMFEILPHEIDESNTNAVNLLIIPSRQEDLLRRAADLQRQRTQLADELAKIHEQLETAGVSAKDVTPSNHPGDDLPDGLLRRELERLLGLRQSAFDTEDPLARGPPIEEAEELAKLIVEGGKLPPLPTSAFSQRPEPEEKFMARLERSIQRFEAMVAGKKARRQQRRSEASIEGWDDDKNESGSWFDRQEDGVFPKELTESVPAPEVPEDVIAAMQRAERVAYTLRQAYKECSSPKAGIMELSSRGLVSPSIEMEDPWIAVAGMEAMTAYLRQLEKACIRLQLDTIFVKYYQYRPTVGCYIVIDTFMHLPLPDWYLSYLALNPQEQQKLQPLDPAGPRRVPEDPQELVLDEASCLPTNLYPKMEANISAAEEQGSAHKAWMQEPHPMCCARQVLLGRRSMKVASSGNDTIELNINYGEETHGIRVLGLLDAGQQRGMGTGTCGKASLGKRPSGYSALPPASTLITSTNDGNWEIHEDLCFGEKAPPSSPPLPREGPADLDRHPLTSLEAEQLLKLLLGDKFNSAAAQLPERAATFPRHPAQEWQQGDTMTVAVSWFYEVDTASGQVTSLKMEWGWVGGPFSQPMDAYDVYVKECDLVEWQIPEAEEEDAWV